MIHPLPFMPATAMSGHADGKEEVLRLNVGGKVFETARRTLVEAQPDSLLAKMFRPGSEMHPSEFRGPLGMGLGLSKFKLELELFYFTWTYDGSQ